MNKKIIASLLGICMIVTAMAGCKSKETKKEYTAAATKVSSYTVDLGNLENKVKYTGTIVACDSVSISSKVSAKALNVSVTEGDLVEKGQTLLTLDKTDIELSYKQAQAAYNSAVAGYNSVSGSSVKQSTAQANQSLVSAQSAYDQALLSYNREKTLYENNSNVTLAQQKYNDAKLAYEREKNLYDNNTVLTSSQNAVQSAQDRYNRTMQLFSMGGATQLELTEAKTALDNAEAALASAKSGNSASMDAAYSQMVSAEESLKTTKVTSSVAFDNAKSALTNAENALKNAKENIGLTANANRSAISTSEASVNSAKASLDIAANSLKNTTVTAPIAGYVSKCNVTAGQNVAAGIEIFEIKNTDLVDAEIKVTEAVIPFVNVGTKALISVSSASISDISGTVTAVNPVKDDKTGLYDVKVTINNDDDKLKSGMIADITLITSFSDSAVRVPSEAVITDENDEYFVYKINGKKAEKTSVLKGIDDGEYAEIIAGVDVGDKIVVSGKEYISDKNNEINVTEKYKPEK